MGQVISAGILLVVVVAIYIAVSYKHEKSGLGKGCHDPERRLKQCVGSKARDRKRRSDAQPE